MNKELIKKILDVVSRVPSAHNTQPLRWNFSDNKIQIFVEEDRLLHVSDKQLRDLHLTVGAAFYLLKLALSAEGYQIENLKLTPLVFHNNTALYLECEIKTKMGGQVNEKYLRLVKNRACYRGHFEHGKTPLKLTGLNSKLTTDPKAIKDIAETYDDASVFFLSKLDYANELWSWLRLDRTNKRFYQDGLNGDMLRLNSLLLILSRFLMKPVVLQWLNRFGLIKSVISEAPQNLSAEGFAYLLRDHNKTLFEQGEELMEMWLEIEASGRHFCPVTSLIDHIIFREKIETICQSEREIIHIIRLGIKPEKELLSLSPRRPLKDLLLE